MRLLKTRYLIPRRPFLLRYFPVFISAIFMGLLGGTAVVALAGTLLSASSPLGIIDVCCCKCLWDIGPLYHPLQCHDCLRAAEMGLGHVWSFHGLLVIRFTSFSVFTAPIHLRRKHRVAAARPRIA